MDIVEELLRHGAKLDKRDNAGNTCLHLAAVHDTTGMLITKPIRDCLTNVIRLHETFPVQEALCKQIA